MYLWAQRNPSVRVLGLFNFNMTSPLQASILIIWKTIVSRAYGAPAIPAFAQEHDNPSCHSIYIYADALLMFKLCVQMVGFSLLQEVRVRFQGFGPEEDEWVHVKRAVRERSIPLESSECHKVEMGDLVLCFQVFVLETDIILYSFTCSWCLRWFPSSGE